MVQSNHAMICVAAFSAVFVILAVLAGVMQIITSIPQKATPQSEGVKPLPVSAPRVKAIIDAAQVAAISSAYQGIFPGKHVIRIEEIT
ncbi:MAG: hypothetical protein P9L92_08365 [Candidatus Electryonea clarkiae]|nr:hypothetical protein [Candidatus Electryonea clarkiae]MDP8288237.1 hypothetical protein [Candidatus Electryonea clarkiae]